VYYDRDQIPLHDEGTFAGEQLGISRRVGGRHILNILTLFARWLQRCGFWLPIPQQLVYVIAIIVNGDCDDDGDDDVMTFVQTTR